MSDYPHAHVHRDRYSYLHYRDQHAGDRAYHIAISEDAYRRGFHHVVYLLKQIAEQEPGIDLQRLIVVAQQIAYKMRHSKQKYPFYMHQVAAKIRARLHLKQKAN